MLLAAALHQRTGIGDAFEGDFDRDPAFRPELILDVVGKRDEGTASGARLDFRGEGVFLRGSHYRLVTGKLLALKWAGALYWSAHHLTDDATLDPKSLRLISLRLRSGLQASNLLKNW